MKLPGAHSPVDTLERLRTIIKWSQWPPWAGIKVPETALIRIERKCSICSKEKEPQAGFYPNFDVCIECVEERESEAMWKARKETNEWVSKLKK